MMKKCISKITEVGLINLFPICIFIIQFISYIITFVDRSVQINKHTFIVTLIDLFKAIKNAFTTNWLMLSFFFSVVCIVSAFYYSIIFDTEENKNVINKKKIISYIVTILNVAFCINFFDIDSMSTKLSVMQESPTRYIVTIAIILTLELLSKLANIIYRAKQMAPNIQKVIIKNETLSSNDPKTPQQNNSENTYSGGQSVPDLLSDMASDTKELLKHPFLYRRECRRLYRTKKKLLTYGRKINQHNANQQQKMGANGPGRQKVFTAFSISTIIVVFCIIAFIVFFLFSDTKEELETIFSPVISEFRNVIDKLPATQNTLITFLLSIGAIILIFITFIIVVYMLSFMLKVWSYIYNNSSDDTEYVSAFAEDIRLFFYGTVTEVMGLLLFIPDFLDTIEETLLDMNFNDIKGKLKQRINTSKRLKQKLQQPINAPNGNNGNPPPAPESEKPIDE